MFRRNRNTTGRLLRRVIFGSSFTLARRSFLPAVPHFLDLKAASHSDGSCCLECARTRARGGVYCNCSWGLPGGVALGPDSECAAHLVRTRRTVWQSACAVLLSTRETWRPCFSIFLWTLGIAGPLSYSRSRECVMVSHCGFHFHCPCGEYLFTCVLFICVVFRQMSVHIFYLFKLCFCY